MNLGPRGAISNLGPKRSLSAARRAAKRALFHIHPFYNTRDTCPDRALFILGCGRSGTTLLREMIDRHPAFAIGPETHFLCDFVNVEHLAAVWNLDRAELRAELRRSPNVVRFAETFFRAHAEREGKPRWGDKTPRNVAVLPWLLHAFPNAHVVHIIRDGRDVACSRSTFRTHRIDPAGRAVERKRAKTSPIAESAREWVDAVSLGLAFRDHPRVAEVRYEALLDDAERELRRLCDFLGEPFDHAMLDARDERTIESAPGRLFNNEDAAGAVRSSARNRWRRDMTRDDRLAFATIAGSLLETLGYAADETWIDEMND